MIRRDAPRLFLYCVLTVLTASLPASTIAEDRLNCRPGEYVFTVSSVNNLKQKTIQEVSDSSDAPIAISDESHRAILIRSLEKSAFMQGKAISSSERHGELCARVRNGIRTNKRRRAQHETHAIIRNISCSCNATVSAVAAPNDPLYPQQWGLNQANNIDIDAPEAWAQTPVMRKAYVAVIDTGVDYNHPDLAPNMWRNPGEIADNGIDDDANGYVDDVYGLNAITGAGSAMDDNGHGTHCAGVIGAAANNSLGITGINATGNIGIIGAKFLGSNGSGSYFHAIRAIDYLIALSQKYGFELVATSNSWGGAGTTYGPLGDAINRQQTAGILFIAAAGNSATNIDVSPFGPAEFGADIVVSVAAVDSSGALASFSNYGATKVDVGAPGVRIASTYPNNRYVNLDGTSMATPFVSGAVAFIWSAFPGITWSQIKTILMTTGKPLSGLSGKTVTGRMINLNDMVNSARSLPLTPPTPSPTPTNTVTPRPTATFTPSPTPTMTPTLVPGYWNVSGTVLGNGAPVANAVVRLTSITGTVTRMTDSAGRYVFNSIYTSPSITVAVEASGFSYTPQTGALGANRVFDFSASAQTFMLSGRIVNAAGTPIAGLAVSAGALGTSYSDSSGYVRFSGLYGTQYSLSATGNSNWAINLPTKQGTLWGNTERVWVASPP